MYIGKRQNQGNYAYVNSTFVLEFVSELDETDVTRSGNTTCQHTFLTPLY